MSAKWQNWAKNVECNPKEILKPSTEQEIINIINQNREQSGRLRVVGNGHSFTELDATNDTMINLSNLQGLIDVDKDNRQATAWAGTSIKNLNHQLFENGLNIINLGDIDVQSIAGATATGTHGTGVNFGNISSQIAEFTIATADGQLLKCSATENTDLFNAGRVSLGSLGIITQVKLDLSPSYKLEYLSKKASLEDTLNKLEEYNASNRNFEFYWFPYTQTVQLKFSNETSLPVKDNKTLRYLNQHIIENGLFGLLCNIGKNFEGSFASISKIVAAGITTERKINHSHLIYATPRNVLFKEMEYNIPIEHFKEVMNRIVDKIHKEKYRVYIPIECRFVKGDDIWLSPSCGRDSAYMAFHVDNRTPHQPYFNDIEKIMLEYGGRPHWGKMHSLKSDTFSKLYPKWNDFVDLKNKLDPQEMFSNDYVKEIFSR
jgi:FAD-linked oxidoreductase